MPSFAETQPPGFENHVENVAIVGIGGRSGAFMAEALIRGGKHRVTAITRPESSPRLPLGLHDVKKVDYGDRSGLVKALTGQDVLIITMAVRAPPDTQAKLIDTAAEAGVKWIMPNEWGGDISNDRYGKNSPFATKLFAAREHIEKVGLKWIGMCCGFWYEFSLAGTEGRYGFDFEKKTVTFYDDGTTKINTSTWPLVGEAVAKVWSLKILPENESDTSLCLSRLANKSVNVSSFFVSQRDMLDSVLRVTGDSERNWTITHEDVVKRYERGTSMMKEGKILGYLILMYARTFYKDGAGDYRDKLDNDRLGLQRENLDAATKVAIEMAHKGETNEVS